MNSLSFTYKGKPLSYTAPSVWNEVSIKQLLLWVCCRVNFDMAEEDKLALAVPVFYGIKSKVYADLKPWFRLQIAPTLRKVVTENSLDKWLIKSFRLRLRKYYGPADKLSNLTAHEFFNICEPLYWQFKKTADEDTLNALCAVLFRPKRKGLIDDDTRSEITDAGIGKRANLFKNLKLNYKLAIAFNYEGCRNYIASTHEKAFEGNKGQSKKRGDVTLSLAGGPLGDHHATKRTNLYTFLLHLVSLIEQEEELKRRAS